MSNPEVYDLFNTTEKVEQYAQHNLPLHKTVIERVRDVAGGRELFVDIGCGSGASTRPFSRYFRRVLGVDYSPAQIQLARCLDKESDNIQYIQGSIYSLPVGASTVDGMLGVMIAQFIDIPRIYNEVRRVLKPGGMIMFHGKSSLRVTELETSDCTVGDLNNRIIYIKTKLFKGLWHDRTHFNPLRYSNVPECFGNCERWEWIQSDWYTMSDIVDYMCSWSAAGKYCEREGISFTALKLQLFQMLQCDVSEWRGRVRCEYDLFYWLDVKPGGKC